MVEPKASPWLTMLTARGVAAFAICPAETILEAPYDFSEGSPSPAQEGSPRAEIACQGRREATVQRLRQMACNPRAASTGPHLTAANTVIHGDPWWNPGVEEQATARAHRREQIREVPVYRRVARDTVEDRVMALKARKRRLADAVTHGDGVGMLDGLTEDVLLALLGNVDARDDAKAMEDT